MVVDHGEAPAVAALAVNAPAGVPSIDFAGAMSFADDPLDLKARQTSLAQSRLRVLGPDEARDAHGGHPMGRACLPCASPPAPPSLPT